MNKVELVGTVARNIVVNGGETKVARTSVACRKRWKVKDGESTADFPTIVAFGKNAEFLEKYFEKGSQIEVTGHIQTGEYTNKDGQKVYTTEVVAEEIGFVGKKENSDNKSNESKTEKENADDNECGNDVGDYNDEIPDWD